MICISEEIIITTRGNCDIIDITNKVEDILHKHRIKSGQCTVFSVGSTAGITTIEYEPGLLRDLPDFLEKIIPSNV
ncbi:MAG: YjbQ family protein, partial [Ignavibacteria bacterium]|nr:YjbQ family protein [Ignavibacteria bacterium]